MDWAQQNSDRSETRVRAWWGALGRWFVNGIVATMLVLMIAQGMPGMPEWLGQRAAWLGNRTGLWQSGWSMFAPDPDSMNHHIRAAIWYWDGSSTSWDAPQWRERSLWRKFTGARELEYYDAAESPYNEPALSGLARYLSAQLRPGPEQAHRPKRVEIWVDVYKIEDPDEHGWQPIDQPLPLTKSYLLYEEDYP